MAKEKIDTLRKLKNKYPLVFEELLEQFEVSRKKLKNFDLDYFVYEKDTSKFFISLSSGIADELQQFDMNGELIDDEISVNFAGFSKDGSSEDVYDIEGYRESYNDEEEHDNDF